MREKRQHPRFEAGLDAVATIEGTRMTLADISQAGLGLHFFSQMNLPRAVSVDLDCPEKNLHLYRISCRIKVDRPLLPDESQGRAGRHLGLELVNPDGELLEHLERFIKEH
jgi:hypothetical protein